MILVTGATGMFGSRIVRETAARGAPVRGLVHDASKADVVEAAGGEVAVADMDRPETLDGVLEGVQRVFLLSPMTPAIERREKAMLEAAERAGVELVVKLYGAVRHHDDPLDRLHKSVIEALRGSGIDWALVSPNTVMESNLLPQAGSIAREGAIVGCAGEGRVGMVAADDVARAAAVVLTRDGHAGRNYELTGPEALTFGEIAERLGRALGRQVRYYDMPEPEYRKLLVDQVGIPEDQVDMAVMLHFHAFKRGWADLVTDTVEELTGTPARSVERFAEEHREAFA